MRTIFSRLVLLLALLSANCFGQTYQLTDLGAVIGTNSYAQGINNQGQVVGYWYAADGAHAYLYQSGTVTDLGLLGAGGTNNYALSINNVGQVVGFSETTNGSRAFLFQNGVITNLGSLGGLGSYAYGINGGGQIVGYVATPKGSRAYLLDGGNLTDLGTLGGTNSLAFGINNFLQVAGFSLLPDNTTAHAFLWQNGVMNDLNQIQAVNSGWELAVAHGINDWGSIVGWGVINSQEHGFSFSSSGVATDLGVLAGGTNSYALGINNSNQVVGASSSSFGKHAVVWQNGFAYDLNSLINASGWELIEASGINDLGQIVGWGAVKGLGHAFLLTPVVVSPKSTPLATKVTPALLTGGNVKSKSSGNATIIKPLFSPPIPPPTLQLQMPFTNGAAQDPSTTSAASYTNGGGINITMNMFSNGVAAFNLHGTTLDMTTNTCPTQGTNQPVSISSGVNTAAAAIVDLLNNTTLTNLGSGNGSITNFTVTMWFNQKLVCNQALVGPRLWVLNAGASGTDINGSTNSMGMKFQASNQLYFDMGTVDGMLSGMLPGSVDFPANQWIFIAVTYDGTTFNMYYGTPTNSVTLIGTTMSANQSISLGSAACLAIGNRATDYFRGFNGRIQDFRIYNGGGSSAFVDGVRSQLPTLTVTMTNPVNNASYFLPTNITINASTADGGGTVTQVQFFVGSKLLGTDTSAPYNFTWTNATMGLHSLTAIAKDDAGLIATSSIVNVILGTNLPPVADAFVRNGASFQNLNFGTTNILESEKSGTSNLNRDSYFKFDLSSISGATNLQLKVFAALSGAGAISNTIYSVSDNSWIETNITWNNAPALGTPLITNSMSGTAGSWYLSDVTTYINSQLAVGSNLVTLVMHDQNNTALLITANSRENSTGQPSLVAITTNALFNISITSPANGAAISAPTNLTISASATDVDDVVTQVQFFAGGMLLGSVTNAPFNMTWSNVPAGTYVLTAIAADDYGLLATSGAVNITVSTNLAPVADAHVRDGSFTNTNFGTNTIMEVQTAAGTGTNRDDYFKFDLSNVSNNVSSAKLNIFATVSTNAPVTNIVYSVTNTSWGETTITWSNKPSRVTALATNILSGTNGTWYSYDVTSFVQAQQAAGQTLVSMALHDPTNIARLVSINSKENSTNIPALIIITTNAPPSVSITSPTNNTVFTAPANISINAAASDDSAVSQVQFFQGTTGLGIDTNAPYSITWNGVTTGNYALKAVATDNYGLVSTSSVVNIIVDNPPTVTLTNPVNNAVIIAGSNLTLNASAADSDGTVKQVQFFQGTNSLGIDTNAPYAVTWTNVPSGSYALTACATDNNGLITTSSVVNIIADIPPTVSITSPTNNTVFTAPASFSITATAGDDGSVSQVQFFQGTTSLGIVSNSPYSVTWTNVATNNYVLTAVAMDNYGLLTTSSVVNVKVVSLYASNNVSLWLKADAIAGLTNNAHIATWFDSSGLGNNATQTTTNSQPFYVTNALNGLPVVQFNGGQSFGLPNFLNPLPGAEVFVVLKTSSPTNLAGLWHMGGNTFGSAYPYSDGSIVENFGTDYNVSEGRRLGVPAQTLTQYHVYQVSALSNNWAAWINGQLLFQTTNNTVVFDSGPGLGANANGNFNGSIAEVLLFNRALTISERLTVNSYLNGKYALVPTVPATPTNLVANAIAPTQVELTWDELLNGGATQIAIERSLTSNGVYQTVAQIPNTTSYVDTNLSSGTTYYYQVQALNLTQWSPTSNVAQASTPALGGSLPFGSLLMWLKADAGLVQASTNTPVSYWADQSGNGNGASQTGGASGRPLWVPGVIGDRPVIKFSGGQAFNLPSLLTGLAGAEVFMVLNVANPTNNEGLWYVGDNEFDSAYPYTDGSIHEVFGSTSPYQMGVPAQPLTQYHIYNVSAPANNWGQAFNWATWVNNQLLYETSLNSLSFPDSSQQLTLGTDFNGNLNGTIAEVLIFSRGLTVDERDATGKYLAAKYNLSNYATNSAAPGAPTNFIATGVTPYQISLKWNSSSNIASSYAIERKLGTNGAYQEIGSVMGNITNFLDANVYSPTNQFFYRVKARNFFGYAYSAEISPPTASITNPPSSSVYSTGTNITVNAAASDLDGSVTQVNFWVNNTLYLTTTNAPYTCTLTNLGTGTISVMAQPVDNQGNSSFSTVVNLIVSPDTDGDGINDFQEILTGTDPTNPLDPGTWTPPVTSTAPTINLIEPSNAVLVP